MLIGYARTSTLDQKYGIEAQERDLLAAGCEKIFREQVSSVDVAHRDQLAAAIDYVRDGDTLVVTKLDRLARSVGHLAQVSEALRAKKANLRVIQPSMDTGSAMGNLTFNTLAAFAQFEREIMLERQREGIAKAKAEGKYKGRKPTAMAMADKVKEYHARGIGPTEIAEILGIGRASVYRALKA